VNRALAPYLTLGAFVLLMSVPFSWAVAAIAAAAALRVTAAVAGRATRRRTERELRVSQGPGLVLGCDQRGREVSVTDRQLGEHGLIVGASGAGKSTTLLAILTDRIERGLPVVALDLKGSPSFAAELSRAARRVKRPFRTWTPDGPTRWNPLAHGNATELKDKLIATERFTEPHYERAAERYLQTALQVLLAKDRRPQLAEVVALMEPRRLAGSVRGLGTPLADRVQDYVASLTFDQLSAVRGLGTRLAILSESHAGPWLAAGPGPRIDLRSALAGNEVVVFSLNSSIYGKLAAQLGTLAIQDLLSATGHRLGAGSGSGAAAAPAIVAIDEFSALGSDHVLHLLARGREAGVGAVLSTQELADLERAAHGFRDQVLGLTAVKIVHRQDVPASAQLIAQMTGTELVWEETRQIRGVLGGGSRGLGTRRQVERYVVHPNEIKALQTGNAVLLTKTPVVRVARIRVMPAAQQAGSGQVGPPVPAARTTERRSAPAPARGIDQAGPARGDQPDPGVTR
jgi:type IV secretory pathway TraG/TraD family ATPase VirD4